MADDEHGPRYGVFLSFGKATAIEFARHGRNVVAAIHTPAGETAFEAMPNLLAT